MTATDTYSAMLAEYQPRTLRDVKSYEAAVIRFEQLMKDFDREPSADLGSIMDLCAMAIAKYEDEHHPEIPKVEPRKIVAHLLEARGGNASALASELGMTRGQMSNILTGARPITVEVARSLGDLFRLPPRLFLGVE